jgi:Fe-S cluster biogenesis protein NfuA
MKDRVIKAIERIRPYLRMDGGDIEFVDLDEKEGIVRVRLKGACGGCPMSTYTLTEGVEQAIREEVPEVKRVVQI